jgi:ATP-binding cassette subfamily B protein
MNTPLRQYGNLLLNYLRPQRLIVALLAVLLVTAIGLQLVNPQIMRQFIDIATQSDPAAGAGQTLVRLAVLFIGVALVQQVVSVLAAYVSENVGWTATNALRADLAEHCLRLDMSFHNRHTPGEMIERIDGDVAALTNFFSQLVIQVLGNGLLLIGVLLLLFREDVRVGLALGVFTLLTLYILARFRNIAVPHWTAERQASAELFGFLEERLAGTEDIRSNGAQAYVMHHFYRLMRALMQRSLKAALMINILLNTSVLLFALGNAVAFGVGAWLFQAGVLSIGSVYIIFHYTTMLERPIRQITHQFQDLQKAGAAMVRVRELLHTKNRITEAAPALAGTGRLPEGPLAVSFRGVSFGYDDALSDKANGGNGTHAAHKEIVLNEVSFQLAPGTVLGLLGRTGSGKTTLTRLLLRMYDPDEGAVCLGEPGRWVDIRQSRITALRKRVGMVTQNIQLFHATVRDNLTFFDTGVPDARIQHVIEELGLGEWLRSLPQGLDTELESGGGGLSAGEAQLLAFARIFLQDPGLVVLDEASSRLDPATERLIERAVERLVYASGRTAIIIAHRLETVQRAHEIMILEEGRVREYGARVALASDPSSRFSELLRAGLEEVLA